MFKKIGFFITLGTLALSTLSVLVMLYLGYDLSDPENGLGALVGTIIFVIAVIALIVIGFVALLMIFYQKSIAVPLLLLIGFGFASITLANNDTPLIYITLGLSIGPLVTIIGYIIDKKETI